MLRHLILGAASAALAMTLWACATVEPSPQSTQPAPDAQATAIDPYLQIVEPVAAGVHVMRQAAPNFAGVTGNVVIIERSDSIVLVDSGNNRGAGERVVAEVRRLSNKPVSAVIITHWHNDHPLGLPAIVAAWPQVEIIASEGTRDHLAAGDTGVPTQIDEAYMTRRMTLLTHDYVELTETGANNPELTQAERDGWARARRALDIRAHDEPGTYLIMPTRTFHERMQLDDSVTPIEISYLGRANTDGDAMIWLPRQRILIAGDSVVWPIPYNFNIYPAENGEVLRQLRAFDYAALIPGHGEVQHGKRYLDMLIQLNDEVRRQVAPLAARGLSLEETTAQVDLSALKRTFAGDDPWVGYWFDQYSAQPLIASAYHEARGEPPA